MTETTVRLPDTTRLVVSSSPHFHEDASVRKIMLVVIAALAPACLAGVWTFGLRALWVLLVCTAACMLVEALCVKLGIEPNLIGEAA